MQVINTKNKTGPGRSPLEAHISLIQEMLENHATLKEVSVALSELGVHRAPNTISEWLSRRKNGYRRKTYEYLATQIACRCPTPKAPTPTTLSLSLHTTCTPTSAVRTSAKRPISPEELAALKAKATKAAEELANRIPQ